MFAVVLILLLALLLFGVGFAVHVLWWIALAVLVLWLLGWAFGAAGGGWQSPPVVRALVEPVPVRGQIPYGPLLLNVSSNLNSYGALKRGQVSNTPDTRLYLYCPPLTPTLDERRE